jgi:hypothetical protein
VARPRKLVEETVAMARSVTRSEAEVRFKNAQKRIEDGRKAVTEHQAAEEAVRERTARLRTLRLAKEAADKEEAARRSLLKSSTKKRG